MLLERNLDPPVLCLAGAEHQRIIPILLEDEYRKTIPKPMAHLTYLDYPRWKGNIPRFWDKLAESLGWIQSQKSCKTGE